jgi:hypothetical protein
MKEMHKSFSQVVDTTKSNAFTCMNYYLNIIMKKQRIPPCPKEK